MPLDQLKFTRFRHSLQERLDAVLWDRDPARLPLPGRILLRSGQIVFAIGRDFAEGQLSLRAMSLVYSTILGFIPTLALIFSVLKSLGVHNAMEPTLLTLLEALGDRREQVTRQIIDFVDNIQVELIGITSVGLLIYLVLDMMRKIESSFNYIWGVTQGRSWSSRVSEYLFAVIVSPVLLFISISITSSVNTVFFAAFLENLAFGSTLVGFFAVLFPMLFMSLAFAFAYSFLPNTKVRFSSAFIGGAVTTIVWKLMGAFFQGFLITAARESIYLAFATVIALMIFAYIGWLVALIGADISYYHQYPNKTRTGRQPQALSIRQQEQLALAVAALIIHRFHNRQEPLAEQDISARLGTTPMNTERALASLLQLGLISRTADEPPRFLPQKSIRDCSLVDVWRSLRTSGATPLQQNEGLDELRQANSFLAQVESSVAEKLGSQKFIDSA